MHITTFITAESIITKLNAFNSDYTIFTTRTTKANSQYESIIKFPDYNKVLWSIGAANAEEAAINHAALFNMANDYSVLHWKAMLLDTDSVKQMAKTLQQKNTHAKDDTLNSVFTRKLFKATGMDATHADMQIDIKQIAVFATVLIVAALGIRFGLDW